MAAAAVLALWWAGPPGLETDPFVQDLTSRSVVIARIDRSPSQLSVTVAPESGTPIRVAETQAARDHAVRVEGLRPGVRYRYHFDDEPDVVGSFRAAPVDDRAAVRFAAVGDSGALPWWFNLHAFGVARVRPLVAWTHRPPQWRVAEWIAAHDPDFTIHLGDIVYWPVHLREAHEEAFFRPFAPVLAKAALYTSIGNHDIPRDGSPPPFDSLFQRPASSAPGRSYAFAWGAVRVFVLDNIAEGWAAGGPAHRWLDAELRAAAEPWLVVAMHRPHFTTCREGAEPQRGEPWSLLERHGVDLVISGDDHLYQRFVPPAGPVQIVAGAGGKSLYDCSRDHPQLAAMAVEWSAVVVDARGPVLETRAVGAGGAILDEHRIDRARGPLPAEIGAARRARILALRHGPPAPSAARLRD